jgi:DNA-binding MarR family transcriptional regulator
MTSNTDALLRALISVTGRVAVPAAELRELVTAGRLAQKQVDAYNLCDGTRTQAQIAKRLKLDAGNFSRTVQRWERSGVLFRIGEDEQLLHLYPLS